MLEGEDQIISIVPSREDKVQNISWRKNDGDLAPIRPLEPFNPPNPTYKSKVRPEDVGILIEKPKEPPKFKTTILKDE